MVKLQPKPRSQPLTITKNYIHVGEKHTSHNPAYHRRTISISPKIHAWIQNLRADVMKRNPDDEYDYTTLTNYLMAHGIRSVSAYKVSEDDMNTVQDLVGDRLQLGKRGILDDLDNLERMIQDSPTKKVSAKEKGK